MAITQTSISYYGLNYVEHAERDFQAETIVFSIRKVLMEISPVAFQKQVMQC